MAVNIQLSAFQLIVGEQFVCAEDFEALLKFSGNTEFFNNSWHYTEIEKIDPFFYWFYAEYGAPLPHAPKVFNELNGKQEKNPRSSYHAELSKQLFGIYDVQDMIFYLSNSKKKNFITNFLANKLNREVFIKSIVNSIDDFLNSAKNITNIKLIKRHNLITLDADIFQSADDVFGLVKPEDAELNVRYFPRPITEKFKLFLRKAKIMKERGEITTFVCIGQDDSKFESIFNLENMQYKTSLLCDNDINGMVNKDDVKIVMLNKIKNKNV